MKQVTSVGPHGARVTVMQRRKGGRYVLRWTDPMTGRKVWKTTEFVVLTKATKAATDKSSELQREKDLGPQDGRLTWSELFKHYEDLYLPLQVGKRQHEVDVSQLALWRSALPPHAPIDECEKHVLLTFIEHRRAGLIKVPGHRFRKCGPRAVAADLEWLRRAVNIAIADKKRVGQNPVVNVEFPKNPRPNRPDATWERFMELRPYCEKNGRQNLFAGLMDLEGGLGWRVTSLLCLHLSDIDRKPRAGYPNGRILKRAEFDKEGYQVHIPISDWLAPRVDELLERRKKLNVKSVWVFPAPKNPLKHWTRYYARQRLQLAERRAGIEELDGGDFHPYRRMWANMRKHLPLKDVAFAGCWNERTLLAHYQKSDDITVLKVMNAGLPGA